MTTNAGTKTKTLAIDKRPATWGEVVNQSFPVKILQNSILRGEIKPAYLFDGKTGCGKTTCALIFAKALLCKNRASGSADPCNNCQTCRQVDEGRSADVKYVEGGSDRSVSFVKDVIKPFLQTAPYNGKRIIIIDEAHLYQRDAISMFLTLFEQMPKFAGKSVVILCTTDGDQILEAIRNRCLSLTFTPIEQETLVEAMHHYTGFDREALAMLSEYAGGSFRTMWSFVEEAELLEEEVTVEVASQLIGSVTSSERKKLWQMLSKGDLNGVAKKWKEWESKSMKPHVLIKALIRDLGSMACGKPADPSWREAMALLSAAQSSADSAWPETLYMLSGLPLAFHDGQRPEPEERQPTNSDTGPIDQRVAKRFLFFGC